MRLLKKVQMAWKVSLKGNCILKRNILLRKSLNKIFLNKHKKVLPWLTFECLSQCVSTGVLRHISVPWILLDVPQSIKIHYKACKNLTFSSFWPFIILKCAPNFFYQISMPQYQKGWEPLVNQLTILIYFDQSFINELQKRLSYLA